MVAGQMQSSFDVASGDGVHWQHVYHHCRVLPLHRPPCQACDLMSVLEGPQSPRIYEAGICATVSHVVRGSNDLSFLFEASCSSMHNRFQSWWHVPD